MTIPQRKKPKEKCHQTGLPQQGCWPLPGYVLPGAWCPLDLKSLTVGPPVDKAACFQDQLQVDDETKAQKSRSLTQGHWLSKRQSMHLNPGPSQMRRCRPSATSGCIFPLTAFPFCINGVTLLQTLLSPSLTANQCPRQQLCKAFPSLYILMH